MNQICDNQETIVIRRKGKRSVVLLSLRDYESLTETGYLLNSRANAIRLLDAIESLERFRKD